MPKSIESTRQRLKCCPVDGAEYMTVTQLLARNLGAIAETTRRLDRTEARLQSSDHLMHRSDWRVAFSDIRVTREQTLKSNNGAATLAYVLDLAIDIAEADFGNIQLFDHAECGLRIAASRGFDAEFLDYFPVVRGSGSACALAMQQSCRVVVPDVRNDLCFDVGSREIVLRAGVQSVQSTPLISPSGRLLGMLSTHRRVPGTPPLASMLLLDRLARRTARLLG